MKDIAIIVLAFAVFTTASVNTFQGWKLSELEAKVSCLEQGRVYVGDGFCADLSKQVSREKIDEIAKAGSNNP